MRDEGHLLVPACGGAVPVPHPERGQRAAAGPHLRDPPADGQATATKVLSVPHRRAPHGGAAHRPEARRRDPAAEIRNQSNTSSSSKRIYCTAKL
ncbi:hypothetical protein FOCC_FOCC014525, partial [Frankliniella occidentalis]